MLSLCMVANSSLYYVCSAIYGVREHTHQWHYSKSIFFLHFAGTNGSPLWQSKSFCSQTLAMHIVCSVLWNTYIGFRWFVRRTKFYEFSSRARILKVTTANKHFQHGTTFWIKQKKTKQNTQTRRTVFIFITFGKDIRAFVHVVESTHGVSVFTAWPGVWNINATVDRRQYGNNELMKINSVSVVWNKQKEPPG